MAKVQVKPSKPSGNGLRQVAIVTVAAILFCKGQRVACEENSTAVVEAPTTGATTPVCPDFCNLPADSATRSKAPFRRWYFDATDGECKRFRWGGRGGNKNRFFRRAQCEETCSRCTSNDAVDNGGKISKDEKNDKDVVCNLPIDEGRCDGSQPPKPQLAWHFDAENEKCSPFVFYGFGQPNSNRFGSKADCEETCN